MSEPWKRCAGVSNQPPTAVNCDLNLVAADLAWLHRDSRLLRSRQNPYPNNSYSVPCAKSTRRRHTIVLYRLNTFCVAAVCVGKLVW